MINVSLLKISPLAQLCTGLARLLQIGCAVLFLYCGVRYAQEGNGTYFIKAVECAALFALTCLPRLLRCAGSGFALSYYLLLALAGLLGSVGDVFASIPLYDSLIHTFSGMVCTAFVWEISKKHHLPVSGAIFIFLCVLFCTGVSAIWEMYEFCIFSALKHPPLAARSFLAQFGIDGTRQAAASAVKETLAPNIGTVSSLVENEYDTFCDVLCAMAGSAVSAALLYKKGLSQEKR